MMMKEEREEEEEKEIVNKPQMSVQWLDLHNNNNSKQRDWNIKERSQTYFVVNREYCRRRQKEGEEFLLLYTNCRKIKLRLAGLLDEQQMEEQEEATDILRPQHQNLLIYAFITATFQFFLCSSFLLWWRKKFWQALKNFLWLFITSLLRNINFHLAQAASQTHTHTRKVAQKSEGRKCSSLFFRCGGGIHFAGLMKTSKYITIT